MNVLKNTLIFKAHITLTKITSQYFDKKIVVFGLKVILSFCKNFIVINYLNCPVAGKRNTVKAT